MIWWSGWGFGGEGDFLELGWEVRGFVFGNTGKYKNFLILKQESSISPNINNCFGVEFLLSFVELGLRSALGSDTLYYKRSANASFAFLLPHLVLKCGTCFD